MTEIMIGAQHTRRTHVSYRGRSLMLAAAVLILLAPLTGCSGADVGSELREGQTTPTENETQAAIAAHWMTGKPIRIDLLSLDQVSPKLVLTRFRLTNLGAQTINIGHRLGAELNTDVSGITLVDISNLTNYYPFYASDGDCVCSLLRAGDNPEIGMEPQESISLFAYFPAPPEELEHISVHVPEVPPFIGVPIGSRNRPVPTPDGQPKRNPFKLDLNAPFTKPIVSVVEAQNGDKSVEEDDQSREVTLSADVLFELNESSLTAKARTALEEVASNITRRKPKIVHIDGYTDTSGSSDINVPLSKDRANAVEKALKGLVNASDVSFEAKGHGADDPVAPNNTPEGRQKNRRVTITYNK